MSDWIDHNLRDRRTGLIIDGVHSTSALVRAGQPGEAENAIYSYCQGVALGLDTELAVRLADTRHAERVHTLVDSVENQLTRNLVIVGGGGGDGGLFNAILARYLAVVAAELPGDSDADDRARELAAAIVLRSAEAAWENRLEIEDNPLFGHDWNREARLPGQGLPMATFAGGTVRPSEVPERDLSVQLGGWMLMEAAHRVAAAGFRS